MQWSESRLNFSYVNNETKLFRKQIKLGVWQLYYPSTGLLGTVV
jgi:hypothetical protein